MHFNANDSILVNIIASVVVILAGTLLVKLVNRFFSARLQADNRGSYRAWTVASRNLVAAVVFLLLLGIWVSELKSVAISLAAFAAALLLVGKELVMCFLGAFMRMITRPFQLGDLVEIGPFGGEVIDMDVMSTTLVEVAAARQYTGFTVQVPNSMLLTTAVRNHSQAGAYTLDMVRIPLAVGDDPEAVEALLVQVARRACEGFMEEAGRTLRRYGDMRFVDLSQFEPRVIFEPFDVTRFDAVVRFPVPVSARLAVAQQIVRGYYRERTQARPADASDALAPEASAMPPVRPSPQQ
ncbi:MULTISPECIES: mechanosensitive ion channel family protein [unclassified Cupriavidus]|uniref:mechanosensitive ion channel domain-containing protein n=1 Tax=unclassified Cupriavidus TaxID=2640874 RepID=UPI001C006F84|nr:MULTISPECIES: mechanosensitive ion channel family protein [unclassified Cupriavidus]MCA3185503.1 mechanosensitive ion channel family protein [Cupriavidus sp.]MCA3193319.1 mechanosensitive ion channel family protein [Cupriavidus sp.]MCA3200363.1 mechanosensitive ion channel family protein [Cupriavidus sp.]MCA3204431.1 mechanosensitive ion channel family protein [Cupriavidus sp.]MCA3205913.1 mechanosensitive ion channel family protein [Cupriavidus sp.]